MNWIYVKDRIYEEVEPREYAQAGQLLQIRVWDEGKFPYYQRKKTWIAVPRDTQHRIVCSNRFHPDISNYALNA